MHDKKYTVCLCMYIIIMTDVKLYSRPTQKLFFKPSPSKTLYKQKIDYQNLNYYLIHGMGFITT